MRSTHISIIHRPLDTRIFEKECRALAAHGQDVHFVVGSPPADLVGGVRFHSIAADSERPPLRRQGARLLRATRYAFRLRPSIYHLHDPHLIPLGVLLKLAGARVIYDVHEDYPAHARSKLAAHPLRGRLKALVWKGLEWLARRTLDGFVCASPALARRFPAARTAVVGNYPDLRQFALARADPSVEPYCERRSVVVYVGDITPIRGFSEMVAAIERLPGELDCRLRLIGAFQPAQLVSEVPPQAWSRIDISAWQPPAAVVGELLRAKVGLVLLHPQPNHGDPVRSRKLFEYMAAGIPVVACDLPRWRALVERVGCGLVVDPRDPRAVAAAIEHLLRNPGEAEAMGARGRAAVEAEFNWDMQAPRLRSFYGELTSAR